MSRGYRRLLAGLAALACAAPAWAQSTGTISGRVVDRQSQRPVASVQVRIVGTTRGAQTDESGAYRIVNVPTGVAQLVAQRIGYGPQSRTITVPDGGTVTADFQMAIAATTLDQVVVTATGQTERRRENGATTASIDSSQLNKAAISTFADALSSRAPGVVVQTAAGETGAGSRIRIRGSNSISLSNEPLIILDGVRMDNTPESTAIDVGGQLPSRLNDINAEEIESIEVIKGPAAAALYGTAASNGVIQITTKKGRAGRARWDTFGELGTLQNIRAYPLNLRSYGKTAAGTLVTNCSLFSRTNGRTTACVAIDSTIGNNPIEAAGVFNDGNRRILGASAAGGSDIMTYFVSGEYQKEQNVISINNQQRMNIRTNLRAQLARNLDAQINIGYVNSDLRRPQNDNNSFGVSASLLGGAADCRPGPLGSGGAKDHPGLCLSGTDTVSHGFFNRGISPYDFYNIDTRQTVQRLTGGLTSNWTPLSWLVVNGTFGADINHRADTQTLQPDVLAVSETSIEGSRGVYRAIINNFTTSLNATATYDPTPVLKLTTSVGSQYVDAGFTRTDAFGAKLLAGTGSLAGTSARFSVGELSQDVRTLGFLAREQIAWRDHAFLTLAARTDKNSAFGANFQRVIYPSLSASWVVNEEGFFPRIEAVSSLRLRAAIGSAGQNPGYLAAEQFYSPVTAIVQGADVPAFTVGGSGNPNLKPEKSTEMEGGFDLGLFGDRVNLEYTHYNKITKDALVNVVLAPSLGSGTNRFQNLGQVRNFGDEALLRAAVFNTRNVKFDFTVNGSWTTNRLDDLGVDENGVPIPQFTGGFNTTQIFKSGLPLGSYFDRALTYNDANGDGLIACPLGAGSSGCEYTLADEATFQGTPFPSVELAFSPVLSVGPYLRVTATVDHRGGQKLYNLTGYYRNAVFLNGAQVQTPSTANLAQQAAAYAAVNEGVFTGFFEDASFTKLREVALTLTMPQTVAARLGAGSASLTLAGRNLKTWTNYSGIDPELNAGAQSNFTAADFLTVPQVRYFTARLALSF
jgi:TonB-dependent starch-binding outer membrane protein SusC